MDTVPLEIVQHISSYLEHIADVNSLSRCNKQYRKLIPVTVRAKDNLLMLLFYKHIDLSWNMYSLTDIMMKTKHDIIPHNLNWNTFVLAKYMPLDYVFSHTDIDGDGLSLNPYITMQTVLDYPDINWSYYDLSHHPNITWDDVINNPQIEWIECQS